jgi:hypothetical protein
MKSCAEIRDAMLRGETLADPDSRAHLDACSACAELAKASSTFTGAMPRDSGSSSPEVDALLVGVKDAIAREDRPLAWLRNRPTWLRRLVALFSSYAVITAVVAWAPRPDLDLYSPSRMAAVMIAWGVLLLIAGMIAVEPAHHPAHTTKTIALFAAICLVGLLCASLMPPPDDPYPAAGADLISTALRCFSFGVAITLPVFLVSRLLDQRVTRAAALLSAAAAGLTANLALQLHCPITSPAHLVAGHCTVAFVFIGIAGFMVWRALKSA